MDFGDSEYRVDISCPNCGNKDVIVECTLGLFSFSACKKCGFRREKKEKINNL